MRKLYTLLATAFISLVGNAQIVNIPDANFKAKLLQADSNNMIAMNLSYNYFKIDANNDGEIQVSEANQVSALALDNSGISNMAGINAFPNIFSLICSNNQITTLDLSNNTNIYYLYCDNNQLTNLNITGLTNLTWLYCQYNNLSALNMTPTSSLQKLNCYNNQISSLVLNGLPNLTELNCRNNSLSAINVNNLNNLQLLNVSNNSISTLSLTNLINLRELSFESNLITAIDLTNLNLLNALNCANNQIATLNLNNQSALTTLNCSNNLLTSLNFSTTPNLTVLICSNNNLGTINISNLSLLQNVTAFGCSLTQFTSNQHPFLHTLILYDNLLSTLAVNNLTNLNFLSIGKNDLTTVNIDDLINLIQFECYLCEELNTISFQNNVNLDNVTLAFTNLTSLDFSSLTSNLEQQLALNDNPLLSSINIKNGVSEANFSFSNCPNLQYICADESEIATIQNNINIYGLTNCHTNSYCSFTPGGPFYTIQGINKLDSNNNGCDINDLNIPNLKLNFSNSQNATVLIPDATGNYQYDVQEGTYTFIPILDNPAYFNVSPSTATASFPATANPFIQNFCLTPNGTHNDLEVTVLPIGPARPGFDAQYKIIYKNKGTHSQSGTINFTYDDSILQLVSANPNVSSQGTDSLTWSFTNLLPFESREIQVVLNLNSPLETPSVNAGNWIVFLATISGAIDETQDDNSSVLTQIVVNSFDPNDKICTAGTMIPVYLVGKYVNYVIRFENTGTFAAENIVVKDIIDTTKFDIATLLPLSGSHSFTTKISNTNQVEFIFENINLPFDNTNNDGYVAFKIKTKPSLIEGDIFSNSASIYFDYNAPIVTNDYATTIIQPLNTNDYNFSDIFSLSPVPTKNVLTITTKESITISSTSIYNTLGQLVQVNTNPIQTIDVSGLQSGNYFIKITSDKGTSTAKFIKE
jgi:Leucine-rich repeat (LRR) protein